jgi:hypothetical protein
MIKFYDFSELNAAAADQASGATIKPIVLFK